MDGDELENKVRELANLILEQRQARKSDQRYERMEKVLLLLARGAMLSSALIMPGTAKLLKNNSSFDPEWKVFNESYLQKTLKKLAKNKVVESYEENGVGLVRLTQNGKTKILKFGLDSLVVAKPARWDWKWRLVFYDVNSKRSAVRDKFRHSLVNAGFYRLQESVYLHAYPCEREIEFLKYYLGISGEVRIVVAEQIENDREFRDFFGV